MIHNTHCGYFGLVTSFCPAWIILWHAVEKKKLSGIQDPVCRHDYNPPHILICDDPKLRLLIFCLFFPSSFNLSFIFILCMSLCSCECKLEWKISWWRPLPPCCHLPFADSGSSEKHLKHRDVSEPELSAFCALLFSLLALLSQYLFAWHHLKTYLQWDFFLNFPVQRYRCTYFPFLLPFPVFICEYLELLLGEWLYQGKLHLIQVIPYTYRAAFLLFSICYASPLRAWSVRLGNLIQVAQRHA